MQNMKIKPVLHWNSQGSWLFWDHLELVVLEKTERNGKPYCKLKYPEFGTALADAGFPDVEMIWEDEEFCEGDFDLYIEDNEKIHDRVKEIFEQIIEDLPYEISAVESRDEPEGVINNDIKSNIALRQKLKEFVESTNPIPEDDDYEQYRCYHLWDEYMTSAAKAYKRAKRSLLLQNDWAAYWNALHAMSAYAAALAILEHDDERIAFAEAICVYTGSMVFLRELEHELDNAYAKRPVKQ